MDDLFDRIKDRWAAENLLARPGVDEQQIAEFEARHGVRLTRELSEYLRAVDGMDSNEWDENFNSFVPLEEIASVVKDHERIVCVDYGLESTLPNARQWYVFCHYGLWLSTYAVRLEPVLRESSPVIQLTGISTAHYCECAPSLTSFLTVYANTGETQ